MQWFDSHCHLDDGVFDLSREDVLQKCRQQGVTEFMVAGIAPQFFAKQVGLCLMHQCHYALGIHPWWIDQEPDVLLAQLEYALQSFAPCALGECGLDRIQGAPWKQQEYVFQAQVKLAQTFDVPLVVHSVKAHDAVVRILKAIDVPRKGVIHGFYGSVEQAQAFVRLGYKIGIGVGICHEKNARLRQVVARLSLNDLLLETDAPFFKSPHPSSNKPSSPEILTLVGQRVAEIKNTTLAEVACVTFNQASQIFKGSTHQ